MGLDLAAGSLMSLGSISDDDSQYPTVDEKKPKRCQPKTRKEGTHAQKLELVALLEPSGLGHDPEEKSRDAEFGVGE